MKYLIVLIMVSPLYFLHPYLPFIMIGVPLLLNCIGVLLGHIIPEDKSYPVFRK